jgi:hypothetical protein
MPQQQATIRARLTARARSRVIVVQQPMKRMGDHERPAFDFGPADKFGEVEILAQNGKQILTPEVFKVQLNAALDGFDPERDYIIAAGDYTVLFFVGMIVGQRFGSARILRWVPSAKAYQPLTFNVR